MIELINEAKKGNNIAFEKIIMNIEKDLYRIAKLRLKDDSDIEDAVQNTIFLAYKNIGKIRKAEYFKTWIIRILINECNAIYKNYGNLELNEAILIEDSYEMDNANSKLDFDNIIKILNYEEKIAITLYYMEGYTNKEIAEILNVNEGTIKSRISRGKEKIRNAMKEDEKNGTIRK